MRKIVTFTSDFGISDPYAGEVKGVLKACAPDAEIIDITHDIRPGNLIAASFVLMSSCRYFPDSTAHLAVVDPGVGTERAIIIVKTSNFIFIGPDNGILYRAATDDGIKSIHTLDIKRFLDVLRFVYVKNSVVQHILDMGPSATFHGRDLFAPLTGYVLSGFEIERVSKRVESMVAFGWDEADIHEGKVFGRVLYIDRFGNLITNIASCLLGVGDEVFVKKGAEMVSAGGLVKTYSQGTPGFPIALIGSRGYLEIAVRGGSAERLLGASCGDEVLVLKKRQ
ncbi:MAG: SAM hydrolase/SAM-dependent halogenase family protein [Spirochaetota bacterium]